MRVSLIAAVASDRIIGREGGLPWHLPADLARFKTLTMGHHLIVGRKTFESIGRPLPGRRMLVVTRQVGWSALGVVVAHGLEEALALAENAGEEEAFIAGGGEIYRHALPLADRLYLTEIDAEVAGDTRFPELDPSDWEVVESQHHPPDERNPHPYRFLILERRRGMRRGEDPP